MDALLTRVTQHAVQYAIRSGISITTGYAIKECGRLLQQAPRGREREELMQLQSRLDSKIRVISPSIDMIELIAARGNTSLGSAVSLTKDLRYEIQKLGQRLEHAANDERSSSTSGKTREEKDTELRAIVGQLKALLARIEDAVPLINLAITTSGVNLSTNLSGTISPSRLLQASTFLTAADKQYITNPDQRHQVGPTYVVSLYMLFAGHASRAVDVDGVRQTTWQEVIHKARLKLWRVPLDQLYALPGEHTEDYDGSETLLSAGSKANEFAYQLVVVEDLDDDRAHDEKGEQFGDVEEAGIRDVVPVHEISKIFYADTGKILSIGNDGDGNIPVLLMKRDVHADPPRRMLQRTNSRMSMAGDPANESPEPQEADDQTQIDAQIERESAPPTPQKVQTMNSTDHNSKRLPLHLDPEWMAFEVYVEEPDDSSSDTEDGPSRPTSSRTTSVEAGLTSALSHLKLTSSSPQTTAQNRIVPLTQLPPSRRNGPAVKTSLSLLEMLIKLTALQQFRQESHLAIEDELLNFFLEDSSTAGAGVDKAHRRRLRRDAAERVGFDPYDESPIKRRTEDYIKRQGGAASPRDSIHSSPNPLAYGDGYGYDEDRPVPRLDFGRRSDFRADDSPSRPHRPPYEQTPSRSPTPDLTIKTSARQPLATPPSPSRTEKTRAGALRGQHHQGEQQGRSPLHNVIYGDEN